MVESPRAELQRPPLCFDDDSSDFEEELLLTQPVERPLAGIIAFVDVRLGRNNVINSGQSISERLNALGATIAPRLTKDVTHIVFKDGRTNLDRLGGKSVFIVSPLWVESCKRCNERVSEAKYPVINKGDKTTGGMSTTPIVLGKIKRVKSMQPKPFEEEVARSVERKRKKTADRRSRNSFERKRPSMVLTSLQQEDREIVLAIVDKLGGYDVSRTVDEQTNHVICGAARRTVNVLAGTAKGCWLLSVDWVWKSLEAGEWLPEGAFEMVSEFPAAQFFRLEHQQAGLLYRPSLFHAAGSIYISQNTKPAPQDLEMLLSIAGAKITASKRKADVCIGFSGSVGENTIVVSEQWIIESISEHVMLPLKDYALNSDGSFVRADSPEL